MAGELQYRLLKNKYVSKLLYTLHHMNGAKLFTENSAIARVRDIVNPHGLGLAVPQSLLRHMDWAKICSTVVLMLLGSPGISARR